MNKIETRKLPSIVFEKISLEEFNFPEDGYHGSYIKVAIPMFHHNSKIV